MRVVLTLESGIGEGTAGKTVGLEARERARTKGKARRSDKAKTSGGGGREGWEGRRRGATPPSSAWHEEAAKPLDA